MLNGKFRGEDIGSGTDVWRFSEEVRAGQMSMQDFMRAQTGMSRSPGTCMTMGSASTYACLFEAMGLSFPYNGTIPGVDAARLRMAHLSGRRIVEMVHQDEKLSKFLTRDAFFNAIATLSAIGGSSNAIIHLLAIAGRVGVELSLEDFEKVGASIPMLVNLQPSGKYLMEDFHYAGGLPAVLRELSDHVITELPSVAGGTIADHIADATVYNRDVIATLVEPISVSSGLWVLRGNICPRGAILKPSAASRELLTKTGAAMVFENIEDMKARINDPDLAVDENSILVLKGCGPKGYPGMAEVGEYADSQETARQRRARHDPHF